MIDLHTHILPGLDDGASSWEDALEMAQTAAETGTRILAATAHSNIPGQDLSAWAGRNLKPFAGCWSRKRYRCSWQAAWRFSQGRILPADCEGESF